MHEKTLTTSTSKSPIGIFDSGIGGLSIAQCVAQMLPNEELIYVADSQYAPYGKLTPNQIIERVNVISERLIAMKVKAIVIACNTATVNAIDQLRLRVNVPIIGVEPAIKPAAQLSKTKSVGLLVTQATAKNTRFLSLVQRYSNGAQVHIQPCPDLANLVEKGDINTPQSYALLTQYLTPLLEKNIDTLVLGCTHYPFLSDQIKTIIGDNVTLIETAKPVTLELIRQLKITPPELLFTDHASENGQISRAKITFYSSFPSTELSETIVKLWDSNQQMSAISVLPFN